MRAYVGRWSALVLPVLLSLLVAPRDGWACSICRCGDATFNALGKDAYAAQGFHLAFDWDRFSKEEGDPAEESESQVENRLTAFVSYGFSDRVTILARVPYSIRHLVGSAPGEAPTTLDTSGPSDPEIYGQLRLWDSRLTGGLGRRASLSLSAGAKTPWGRNDIQKAGERADEHAQSGTGSTDLLANLAFLYLVDKDSSIFLSSGYRHTGENKYGYRYGSTVLANAAYEHKLGSVLDAVMELNFRHAQRDRVDSTGATDANTGGSLLYVTPRLLASLGHGLVLRAAVQVPLIKDLNGFQKERPVINVGLTYLILRD